MKLFEFIFDVTKKYPALIVCNMSVLIFTGVIQTFALILLGPMVDFIMHPDANDVSPLTQKVINAFSYFGLPIELKSFIIAFLIFVLIVTVMNCVSRLILIKIKQSFLRDIMIGSFEDVFSARWMFFTSKKQGDLLNMFSHEVPVISNSFNAIGVFASEFIRMCFFLVIPFMISWKVTIFSFGMAVIFIVPFYMLGGIQYRLGQKGVETGNEMMSYIQQNLTLAKIVLGFGNQKESIKGALTRYNGRLKVLLNSELLIAISGYLYLPFVALTVVLTLYFAQSLNVPLSEVAVLLLALRQTTTMLSSLISKKNTIHNFVPSYENLEKVRQSARDMKLEITGKSFDQFKESIEIKDLSFSYCEEMKTLDHINLTIKKGSVVAFVGESGSGKSTLVDILLGLHKWQDGDLLVDGVSLKDIDIVSYQKHIGYVPQESILFNCSIKDNLLWSKPDATDEEISKVLQLSYADVFIDKMPDKWDSLVGDRGVKLSGGQVQRIALARALLRKPDILILDEATSSLDAQSESLIQKAVNKIAKNTTIIQVAHRLATIKGADCICIIDGGRVIDKGTYQELIQKNERFGSMVKLQELQEV